MLSSPKCPAWEARSPTWAHHHPLLSGQLSLVPCSARNITMWSLPSRLTIQAGETACSDTILNKLQMYKKEVRSDLRKQHQKHSKSMMTNWPNLWPIKIIFLPKTTSVLIVTTMPKQAAWKINLAQTDIWSKYNMVLNNFRNISSLREFAYFYEIWTAP